MDTINNMNLFSEEAELYCRLIHRDPSFSFGSRICDYRQFSLLHNDGASSSCVCVRERETRFAHTGFRIVLTVSVSGINGLRFVIETHCVLVRCEFKFSVLFTWASVLKGLMLAGPTSFLGPSGGCYELAEMSRGSALPYWAQIQIEEPSDLAGDSRGFPQYLHTSTWILFKIGRGRYFMHRSQSLEAV
jgi:hypothetical protein